MELLSIVFASSRVGVVVLLRETADGAIRGETVNSERLDISTLDRIRGGKSGPRDHRKACTSCAK